MQIQPYVFFNGRCEEALGFYADKLGAEVLFKMHYKDAPPDANRPADAKNDNLVMHASVKIGSSILMMSDDCMSEKVTHDGFRLSLTGDDLAHGEKLYNALAEGGTVNMPWQATFWTQGFGMVTDKFGIGWMVTIPDAN
ncbi:VOC family metalloprotein YjdN [Paraburkholderia phenazinium]|uniref:PhnB protein n=1 Tax=Paraburkholderia phenazinium TaxID=60549 RepID=A0A1N6LEN8_9BURK|nr:VOC family metalloprotein YjdN [Paraburkholderia phenazinium]SIO67269.1 PhnB protein [Paraburkholderia phenazinium]